MQQRIKVDTEVPRNQSSVTPPQTASTSGAGKGKDLAAMSQRNDLERAAALQNDARRAAGMPPLERPAAVAVSIPKPKSTQPTPAPLPSEAKLTHLVPLVGPKVNDLVKSIDKNYTLEPQAQEQVLQLVDDFADKVVQQAIRLAQHRGSKVLDAQDMQLILEKQWGIVVPGLGPAARGLKRAAADDEPRSKKASPPS